MGFFNSLLGNQKVPEVSKMKSAVPVADKPEADVGHNVEQGLNLEILAAIAASVNCVIDNGEDAVIAGIVAAIHHARSGGVLAIKIKHDSIVWLAAGRQKIMDSRQFAQ